MGRIHQDSTEAELIASTRSGNKSAFTEIYIRYSPLIYRHAMGVLKDSGAAEDIIQDVFTRIWVKREALDINVSLKSYLFIVCKNSCLRQLRDSKQADEFLKTLKTFSDYIESTTENYIFKREQDRILSAEIEMLPEKTKRILNLSRTGEMSYKEISELESIPVGTIRNKISEAYKILRLRVQNLSSFFF